MGYDVNAAIETVTMGARRLLYIYDRAKTKLPTPESFAESLPLGTEVPGGPNSFGRVKDPLLKRLRIFQTVFREYQAQQAREALDLEDSALISAAAFRAEPPVSESTWETQIRTGAIARGADIEVFTSDQYAIYAASVGGRPAHRC